MLAVRFRYRLPFPHNRLFTTLVTNPSTNHLIDSYGLPPESAATISVKLKLSPKKLSNSDSVVNAFKDYGFSNTQIAQIILKRPTILVSKVCPLTSKLQLFQDYGFIGNHLIDLIVSSPAVLDNSIGYDLRQSLKFLKNVLGHEDKIVMTVRRSTKCLSYPLCKNMKLNIDLIVTQGVPLSTVTNFITKQPRMFMLKPERVAHAIEKVNVLGIQPSKSMFVHAIRVVLSMSAENWYKKMEFLKSLGWNDEDISFVFRHQPLCLSLSEEKIRVSWNFFMDELKYERSAIVSNPMVLMYALRTRVIPRLNVFRSLKSMGLVSEKLQFSYVLCKNDIDFVKKFILPNQERVPYLLDIYKATEMVVEGKVVKTVECVRG